MPRAKELKIRGPNRTGLMGEIATALGDKRVNVRAVNAWVEGDEGVVRLIVDRTAAAKRVLVKLGWKVEEQEVLELELPDKPGAFGQAATAIGRAGVDITHVFVGTAPARKATLFLGVTDLKTALKAVR